MGKDRNGNDLGPNIAQRADGLYCGRFVDKHGKRQSVYAHTVINVKEKLDKARRNDCIDNPIYEDITVDDCFKEWVDLEKPTLSKTTYIAFMSTYNLFFDECRKDMIYDVCEKQLKAILNKMLTDHIPHITQHYTMLLIRGLFYFASTRYNIPDPSKNIKLPKEIGTVFTKEELAVFLRCSTGTFYHNLFVVGFDTGMRLPELLGLKTKDVNFKEGTITVCRNLRYTKLAGKSGNDYYCTRENQRTLSLSKNAVIAIRAQIKLHNIIRQRTCKDVNSKFEDLLFTTKYGTPIHMQNCISAMNNIIDEVNLSRGRFDYLPKCNTNTMRHTFIYGCFANNVSLSLIQSYIGNFTLHSVDDLFEAGKCV